MKIDFLFQTVERIVPIEVKVEENARYLFVNKYFKEQDFLGLRFSLKPYIQQSLMKYVPLYAVESVIKK